MNEVSIIGLDLAKNIFQAHGAGADGSVILPPQVVTCKVVAVKSEEQQAAAMAYRTTL